MKLLGLIGDPVLQSPSPEMHNSAIRALNLDYIYLTFHVKTVDLRKAVEGLRAIGARGFNVTIPHKVRITSLVDSLDSLSRRVGAVNTVVNENGKLKGHNTDISGFIMPLREKLQDMDKKNVTVIGAGGAARACVVALEMEKCENIIVAARDPSKAKRMLASLGNMKTEVLDLREAGVKKVCLESDVIVNATPVGMYPNVSDSPIPADYIRKGVIAYDLIYKPLKTRFLSYAESAGATPVPGHKMLVEQAIASFRIWTGVNPPREVMASTVIQALAGGQK